MWSSSFLFERATKALGVQPPLADRMVSPAAAFWENLRIARRRKRSGPPPRCQWGRHVYNAKTDERGYFQCGSAAGEEHHSLCTTREHPQPPLEDLGPDGWPKPWRGFTVEQIGPAGPYDHKLSTR